MNRKRIILLVLLCFPAGVFSQLHIIPQPASVRMINTKPIKIGAATKLVVADTFLQNSVDFFNDYLEEYYGFRLGTATASTQGNRIVLKLEKDAGSSMDGAYRIHTDPESTNISARSPDGVFYGMISLLQLLPVPDSSETNALFKDRMGKAALLEGIPLPGVIINDQPRFAYRGMHLDVARHFFPVAFVKKYIDYLALHKMNYFHWHLTDDQGWRIAIKKYPLLTKTGGYRNGTIIGHYPGTGNDDTPYGGFYTQEEIKEVVRYAARRYVTIVPEIEMPGHASAAIAAYPRLSCFPDSATSMVGPVSKAGNQKSLKKVQETWGVFDDVFCPSDYTFKFLEDVLDEVMELFPSKYIHIGGDECPKDSWKRSAFCQALMKERGLKDEHALQSYFIARIEKHINAKGRKIIGWDEILEGGLAPNATVMSWRGEEGGVAAANENHNVIMTPGDYVYFDHSQTKNDDSITIGGFTTAQKVYSYEPVPKQLNAAKANYILGAQANMWTEYIASPTKVEYQLFPRLSALSEVLWSAKEHRNWQSFQPDLIAQMKRYRLWKAAYSKAVFNPANNE